MPEYYVDERGGCVAVRERVNYEISPGCHADLPDVIAYWSGYSSVEESGMTKWMILDWQRTKAQNLCDMLNSHSKPS